MRNNLIPHVAPPVLLVAGLLVAVAAETQVLDGVPHLISYQGRLTDMDGDPVTDGEYVVTFRIWRDSISTSPTDREWISPNCTVLVVNGLFNWQLGSKEGLPPWTTTNQADLWLGIQVASDPEITPRTRPCSAPYAYKAWQADYAEYADSAGVVVSSIGESGAYDGDVQADYVETDLGALDVVDFETPFISTEIPHMHVVVVMKQDAAALNLDEGAAVKAVTEIQGTPGNWTGFKINVSKHSGGSLTDGTKVFVTWMAIQP